VGSFTIEGFRQHKSGWFCPAKLHGDWITFGGGKRAVVAKVYQNPFFANRRYQKNGGFSFRKDYSLRLDYDQELGAGLTNPRSV